MLQYIIQQKPDYFLGLKNGSSYSYKWSMDQVKQIQESHDPAFIKLCLDVKLSFSKVLNLGILFNLLHLFKHALFKWKHYVNQTI